MALLVNLFAGPGAGKSTMAALLFAGLKGRGVSAELAPEFAKDLTWEQRWNALRCQPYVFGEQYLRVWRLMNNPGVEVVITDSPLLLSGIYGELNGMPESFGQAVVDLAKSFNRLNVVVNRVKPYDPRGRRQSEASAREIDQYVLHALVNTGEEFITRPGNDAGAEEALLKIVETLAVRPHALD